MKQLLARIDDDLHRRLKERAAMEGRSMNVVVTEILEEAVPALTASERYREKLRREGRLYEPPPPEGPVPSREEIMESLRGDAGRALVEALEWSPRSEVTARYVDSSVLGRAYLLDEPESAGLRDILFDRSAPVMTSELARIELASAVEAAARAGRITNAAKILTRFDADTMPPGPISLIELERAVVLPAAYGLVRRFRLRALDAIHLAVAVNEAATSDELAFVTRDRDQSEAAGALGLTVL